MNTFKKYSHQYFESTLDTYRKNTSTAHNQSAIDRKSHENTIGDYSDTTVTPRVLPPGDTDRKHMVLHPPTSGNNTGEYLEILSSTSENSEYMELNRQAKAGPNSVYEIIQTDAVSN